MKTARPAWWASTRAPAASRQPAADVHRLLGVDVHRGVAHPPPAGRRRGAHNRPRFPRARRGALGPERAALDGTVRPVGSSAPCARRPRDGPPLRRGRRYSLVVDAGSRERTAVPSRSNHVKTLQPSPHVATVPDPGRWSICLQRGARGLRWWCTSTSRSIAHSLFTSVAVVDERGDPVHGIIEVGTGEGEWSFTPAQPWQPGRYRLRVSPELEDAAGNSLERVFDAELSSGSAAAPNAAPVPTRDFLVTGNDCLPRLSPGTCPSTR